MQTPARNTRDYEPFTHTHTQTHTHTHSHTHSHTHIDTHTHTRTHTHTHSYTHTHINCWLTAQILTCIRLAYRKILSLFLTVSRTGKTIPSSCHDNDSSKARYQQTVQAVTIIAPAQDLGDQAMSEDRQMFVDSDGKNMLDQSELSIYRSITGRGLPRWRLHRWSVAEMVSPGCVSSGGPRRWRLHRW